MNLKGMNISMGKVVKDEAVSLDEIKETLENKVNKGQKIKILKEVFTNLTLAMGMIAFLAITTIGKNNIEQSTLAQDIKVIALCTMAAGIVMIETSYKKDKMKLAMYAVEIIAFAAINLCLVYVVKLYFDKLNKITLYTASGIAIYYIVKAVVLAIINTKKYKEQNNDIKDII